MEIQNKKRKYEEHSEEIQKNCEEDENSNIRVNNDHGNIESELFEEMKGINNKLISFTEKVKQVDINYLKNNSEMIDEFLGNMHQFLQGFADYRKKISPQTLNYDIMSRVYQFLDNSTIINCGGVSKMWRKLMQKYGRLNVKVTLQNINSFLNSTTLSKMVTSLKLEVVSTDIKVYTPISEEVILLEKLETLDLSNNILIEDCIEVFTKFNVPRLTRLNLEDVEIEFDSLLMLFESSIMSNIKFLNLSCSRESSEAVKCFLLHGFSKEIFEIISECIDPVTNLNISNGELLTSKGIDVLLKDKPKLEYLDMEHHDLTIYPNLFMNGDLINLTTLDISFCAIKNQDLANLVVSPNLPNLTSLIGFGFNSYGAGYRVDESVAYFPPNSQSSVTNLDFRHSKLTPFPSLFDHCPKLKRLGISTYLKDYNNSKSIIERMITSPCLKNLEYLEIDSWKEALEVIFTNSIYSNLKELMFSNIGFYPVALSAELVSKCNLVNLESFVYNRLTISRDCYLAFQTNPALSKLSQVYEDPTKKA